MRIIKILLAIVIVRAALVWAVQAIVKPARVIVRLAVTEKELPIVHSPSQRLGIVLSPDMKK